jgi:hypothetical protein
VTAADGRRGAWGTRIRAGFLIGCLAACAAYAIEDHPGALSAVAAGGGPPGACKSFLGAREAAVVEPFADVRASLVGAMPTGGYHVYGGVVVPATLWSEDVRMTPLRPASAPRVYAGYQLWWRTRDGRGETDALVVFLSLQDARRFVAEEASVRCRHGAVTPGDLPAGDAPPGSLDVRLTDPGGESATYVFFARGRDGYEASASAGAPGSARARGEEVAANRVACALPLAGC